MGGQKSDTESGVTGSQGFPWQQFSVRYAINWVMVEKSAT
jgi:hypothetical protein